MLSFSGCSSTTRREGESKAGGATAVARSSSIGGWPPPMLSPAAGRGEQQLQRQGRLPVPRVVLNEAGPQMPEDPDPLAALPLGPRPRRLPLRQAQERLTFVQCGLPVCRRRWGSWQRRWWGSWRLGSKGSWVQLTAEAVGFMAASTAFDVLYVYCVELFPTNVRNSAVSMLRQALMLRATVTPQLVVLGRVSPKLFFVVFECLSLFSGALTVWPPETRDAPLYETMEQQESDRREEEAAVKSCWRVRGGAAGARASLSSII
ncbi:hypothetical protein Taro_023664 [Colocasia esculenta]|uniref:Uncharacterized protein n=1 Tax=Colocasia esculenta TaxID=4460 RepID=A0A843VF64_COLES|nr:hypothetical protein [Colocasia esculenta]